MPDIVIALLFGCALGFGVGYAAESQMMLANPAPHRGSHEAYYPCNSSTALIVGAPAAFAQSNMGYSGTSSRPSANDGLWQFIKARKIRHQVAIGHQIRAAVHTACGSYYFAYHFAMTLNQ